MKTRAQRLRLTYARDDAQKYLSHLDVMRAWERALKRARIPMVYSEGFTPRPRIAIAAPLPVGVTSDCELLEVMCSERVQLCDVQSALTAQLPNGIRLLDVREIAADLPSLQSLVRSVDYEVDVPDDRSEEVWIAAIDALLQRDEIPWEHQRGEKTKRYDLRPLILQVTLLAVDDGLVRLRLHLRNDETGSGRPEQVVLALGASQDPTRTHRLHLHIEEPAIARDAFRAAGRRED